MDINNQFDQELLSAYLDDGLTAGELAQVERWLAADPTAAIYLDSLRSNRNTLKALASLPNVGLKASLAGRVLAQVHTADIAPAGTLRLPTPVTPASSRNWWAWGALAASAAVVGWFAIVPLMQSQPHPVSFVPQVELPSVPTEPDGPSLPKHEDLVLAPQPDKAPSSEMPNTSTPSGIGVDHSRRNGDERHGIDKLGFPQALLVGDVLVTEKAWKSGKFDQLLEKHGIRYEKELVAQPKLIKALIDSQVTAGPDADPQQQQNAALVYIDSPGDALDKLLVEIENDSENFVGINYNVAMGGLGNAKDDKLLSALRAQTGMSNGRGIARLIVPDNISQERANLLPGFEVLKKTTDSTLRDGAAANVQQGLNVKKGSRQLGLGGLNSESLIILRKN